MHLKSDNQEIKIDDKADKVIKNFFKSLPYIYQNNLETSMESSDFVFDYPHLFRYKCHKTNPNCGASYVDSPDWVETKK